MEHPGQGLGMGPRRVWAVIACGSMVSSMQGFAWAVTHVACKSCVTFCPHRLCCWRDSIRKGCCSGCIETLPDAWQHIQKPALLHNNMGLLLKQLLARHGVTRRTLSETACAQAVLQRLQGTCWCGPAATMLLEWPSPSFDVCATHSTLPIIMNQMNCFANLFDVERAGKGSATGPAYAMPLPAKWATGAHWCRCGQKGCKASDQISLDATAPIGRSWHGDRRAARPMPIVCPRWAPTTCRRVTWLTSLGKTNAGPWPLGSRTRSG
eukprot:349682-Chlamydomonas_euryale.AAC.25